MTMKKDGQIWTVTTQPGLCSLPTRAKTGREAAEGYAKMLYGTENPLIIDDYREGRDSAGRVEVSVQAMIGPVFIGRVYAVLTDMILGD